MRDITNKEADTFEEQIAKLYKRLDSAREDSDLDAINAVKADINKMIDDLEIDNV